MTTDDMAQVRAALTDEVLDAAWRAGIELDINDACEAMRDVLLSALAPLVRPAPTCATCEHYRDDGHIYGGTWRCTNVRSVGAGVHSKHAVPQNCSLHTPRPSTPEGSAR